METTRPASRRGPLLFLAAVGAAVVLWFAVSAALASGGSGGSGSTGGAANDAGSLSVLPTQGRQAPDDRDDGRPGRDCPERDRGGGSGSDRASELL
jgi:hypothetical protein